jgi:RNA polymerase-associated protein
MSLENAPPQGITLYSHADDFRSHWIRYVLAEKQIKYNLVLTDEDDEDLASLNPYNQLPMLVENELKLFKASIISEYIDDRYRQNKLYADAPAPRAEQRQYIWRFEQDWLNLADIMLRHADSLNINAQKKRKANCGIHWSHSPHYFSIFPFSCQSISVFWTACWRPFFYA